MFLSVDLLVIFSSVLVSGSCPQDWTDHGSSCYFLSHTKANWNAAQDICQQKGSSLVEIETEEESNFIENFAKRANQSLWAGGRDDVEGHWIWVTSGRDFTYTDWWPGQPDNTDLSWWGINEDEDCLQIAHHFNDHWNDLTCSLQNLFVCESKLPSTGPEVPNFG